MENIMSRTSTQTEIDAGITTAKRRPAEDSPFVPTATYRTASVDGLKVFYREGGNRKSPVATILIGLAGTMATTLVAAEPHNYPTAPPSHHSSHTLAPHQ